MTNIEELKISLIRNRMTASDLADALNISRASLSYKMNNKRMFTVTEIAKISEILNLSLVEKERIFFDNEVGEMST